jgi:hypothetical protein
MGTVLLPGNGVLLAQPTRTASSDRVRSQAPRVSSTTRRCAYFRSSVTSGSALIRGFSSAKVSEIEGAPIA